jgi:hypothetical protein
LATATARALPGQPSFARYNSKARRPSTSRRSEPSLTSTIRRRRRSNRET